MALMWLIPFSRRISLPFWTSHAFILLPKRHKIGMILICYHECVTPSDFSIGLQGWSSKFVFCFFSWPFSVLQIPLDLPTALPNLQQWQFVLRIFSHERSCCDKMTDWEVEALNEDEAFFQLIIIFSFFKKIHTCFFCFFVCFLFCLKPSYM